MPLAAQQHVYCRASCAELSGACATLGRTSHDECPCEGPPPPPGALAEKPSCLAELSCTAPIGGSEAGAQCLLAARCAQCGLYESPAYCRCAPPSVEMPAVTRAA